MLAMISLRRLKLLMRSSSSASGGPWLSTSAGHLSTSSATAKPSGLEARLAALLAPAKKQAKPPWMPRARQLLD